MTSNFEFKKTFVFRDRVDDYINQCINADILLCSCYVWNWEITNYLAKEVKRINPACLIIFGGPHVPEDTTGFFDKYPYVDILVHGEGELILENIFETYLKDKNYSNVKGITTKNFKTEPQERIKDFSILPSPFLTNTVWQLVDKVDGIRWDFCWETNRGCPYSCAFCDWGSATFTLLRRFDEEKLFKEIDWFSENKVDYIYCCDANFGIFFERDLRITKKLKEMALKNNHPKTFMVNWAKNSSEKIIPIAKEMQEGGLLTGVTLAVQSLDENTLTIIKRANIKFDRFSNLADQFRSNGLPTYSELIRGLPGETLESFKQGVDNMVGESNIDTVYVYHCAVLPNAPMNMPSFREKYQIKTIHSPIFLRHTSIHNRTIEEYEDIVISTSSATLDDVKEMYLYSWLILTFQSLGVLEYISKYYNQAHGLPFIKFYEDFLVYCRTKKSIFSEEYEKVVDYMNNGYAGNGWNHYDPKLGDIYWPIEEASWLRLASQKMKLIQEIYSFLRYLENKLGYDTSEIILKDLVNFQVFLLTTKNDKNEIKSEYFEFDWKKFFVNKTELQLLQKNYYYKNQILEKRDIEWNYEVMWYGRHGMKFKFNIEQLEEGRFETVQISK